MNLIKLIILIIIIAAAFYADYKLTMSEGYKSE